MKTLLKISFLMVAINLIAGRNITDVFIENETPELKKAKVEITVPFKVNLMGKITDQF